MRGLTYVFPEHPEKGCNKMFQIKGILSITLRLTGLLLVVFLSFAPIKICLAQENITIPLSQIQLIKFEDKEQFDIEKHTGSIFKISLKSFEELSSRRDQVKAEDKIRNRWQLGVKVNYLIPLYEEIDPCLHYNLFFGYSFEKFRKISISNIIESASPSQSLRFAECQFGVAKHTCVSVNPITLPTIPKDVCGARPIIRCPINSSVFLTL